MSQWPQSLEATLDGRAFSQIAAGVVLTDIAETRKRPRQWIAPWAGRVGAFVGKPFRESLSVTLHFVIWEENPAIRKQVFGKILQWSQGKTLTLGDRPGQFLQVEGRELPPSLSTGDYQQPLALTLTAHTFPYWQGTEHGGETAEYQRQQTIRFPIRAGVEAMPLSLTLVGETALSWVTFQTSAAAITLQGVGAKQITLTQGAGVLTIRDEGGQSLLPNRTPASSDWLSFVPGEEMTLTLSGSENFRVYWRCREVEE